MSSKLKSRPANMDFVDVVVLIISGYMREYEKTIGATSSYNLFKSIPFDIYMICKQHYGGTEYYARTLKTGTKIVGMTERRYGTVDSKYKIKLTKDNKIYEWTLYIKNNSGTINIGLGTDYNRDGWMLGYKVNHLFTSPWPLYFMLNRKKHLITITLNLKQNYPILRFKDDVSGITFKIDDSEEIEYVSTPWLCCTTKPKDR